MSPCWTIQTTTVELGQNINEELLQLAMGELGYSEYQYTFHAASGQITVDGEIELNKVKRAYSRQVVLSQAKRFGWKIKETGEYQYEVIR